MPLLIAAAATIECCSIEPHSFQWRERTPFPTVPLVTNAEGIQVTYDSLDVINACEECVSCITERRGLTFDEAVEVLDKAVHILRTSHNGKRADTESATAVFLMVLEHVVHEYPQEQINADMLLYAMDVISYSIDLWAKFAQYLPHTRASMDIQLANNEMHIVTQ